jgi:hypothetical protein
MLGGLSGLELRLRTNFCLYDMEKYVIRPATALRGCAMVELMTEEEQPPDYVRDR